MTSALRSMAHGLWTVLRAPCLLAGVLAVTLAAVVPFGVAVGAGLRAALADQAPISRDAGDIDPEWWMEFRQHARGLEATFTPAVIGFAAPLDNLSAMADRTPRPLVLAVPVAIYGLAWAFLWGGVLHRFARGGRIPAAEFWQASMRYAGSFTLISIAASAVTLLLYLTVHQALFGPVFGALAAGAASERDAFLWRLALYAVFGTLLAMVAAVADYARVSLVRGQTSRVFDAIKAGASFAKRQLPAVALLYVIAGGAFVALLVLYAATETYGGAHVGGWRAIAIGQGFIIARLTIRLTTAAAEMRLAESLAPVAVQPASTVPA